MMVSPTKVAVQKTFVATARLKAMALHGVPAIVITSDTMAIVSPWSHQLIILETNPPKIVMDVAIHTIVIAIILVAALVIGMMQRMRLQASHL